LIIVNIRARIYPMSSVEQKNDVEIRKGVIFAIILDGELVIQDRTNPDKSYFGKSIVPGGKVKSGETAREALKREIEEETGLYPVEFQLLGVEREVTPNGNTYDQAIVVVTKTDGVFNENANLYEGVVYKASFSDAKKDCPNPFSQKIIEMVEKRLGIREEVVIPFFS